jgi:anti-sigma-K factor RskA
MSEHDSRWADLLPLYALLVLEGEERRAVEEHLGSGCPICAAALEALRSDLALLAEAVPPVEPSPLSRRRLMRRIEASPSSPRRARWWWPLVAGLLTVLVAAGLFERLRLQREVDLLVAERESARGELAAAQLRLGELESERLQLARELATITSPRSRQVILAGLEQAPRASAFAYLDPGTRAARFYAFDLPELPADRDYQLWIIADGRPVSVGLLEPDADGAASLDASALPDALEIETWAVTIERAGGVPQPEGPMVLVS